MGGIGALYQSGHELICLFKKGIRPRRNNIRTPIINLRRRHLNRQWLLSGVRRRTGTSWQRQVWAGSDQGIHLSQGLKRSRSCHSSNASFELRSPSRISRLVRCGGIGSKEPLCLLQTFPWSSRPIKLRIMAASLARNGPCCRNTFEISASDWSWREPRAIWPCSTWRSIANLEAAILSA